ncbi:hypothetical protein [Diaphorobacter aerolatus]|uniref:Uncharacterized protein n=1 Tax=Diaphorobacter aerolatus TaxID=1288495 RepID=A0A7H0GKX8_9BURK|nr:hypothetical protein [Diaphorobacter aerolatus]QNP48944.1 hypothetical protein H9K75_01735 [Diaphorobacter aerolatus]
MYDGLVGKWLLDNVSVAFVKYRGASTADYLKIKKSNKKDPHLRVFSQALLVV